MKKLSVDHAPVQALTTEDADLDLSHVQPTRVLGRVVELHPAQEHGRRVFASTSSKHFLKWMFRLSRTRRTRRALAYALVSNSPTNATKSTQYLGQHIHP
ncbi:hypothetical protein [Methylibium sp.]|uniref:hypothetical protein n=1 Tax=Methylibium sp. TaxID=2067992 RepID=UPI003D0EF55B